jgi:hypothetical protein
VIARPPLCPSAPRPAIGRAGRPSIPGRQRRAVLAIASALVAAGIVGGCGPFSSGRPTTAPSPTATLEASTGEAAGSALLLLTRVDDVPVLSLVRPSVGVAALPLPDPSTMAVTPMGNGSLVALLADARAFVAPGGTAGLLAGTGWRRLDLRWSGALPADAIIFAASASPDGKRLAAIARPPFAESPSALVIVAPAAGRAAAWALPDESTGAAPAWVDGDHVALIQRGRAGHAFLAVLGAASGKVFDRITFRALDVGTSGDAGTTVVRGDESRLFVGQTADVLERGRLPHEGPVIRPGDVVRGGVALDRDGRRLAAVIEDTAGASRIAIFERTGDAWRPTARIAPPPGSSGGRVSWLP